MSNCTMSIQVIQSGLRTVDMEAQAVLELKHRIVRTLSLPVTLCWLQGSRGSHRHGKIRY